MPQQDLRIDSQQNVWDYSGVAAGGKPVFVRSEGQPSFQTTVANPYEQSKIRSGAISADSQAGFDVATQPDRIREQNAKAAAAELDLKNKREQYDAQHNAQDPATLDFYARQVLSGAGMPSLGMGKSGGVMRQAIMSRVQQIATGMGMGGADLATQQAHYKAGQKSLGNLETLHGVTQQNEQTALTNGQQFMDRSAELPLQTEYPIVNSVVHGLQRNLPIPGHEKISAMDAAYNTFVNEYAKVVSAPGGGGGTLSDSARHEAMATMNGSGSYGQKQAAFDQMKADMANRMKAQEGAIAAGYANLTKLPGQPTGGAVTSAAANQQQSQHPLPIIGAGGGLPGAGGGLPGAGGGLPGSGNGGGSGVIGANPNVQPGGGGSGLASGASRHEPVSPQLNQQLETLVRSGRPINEINQFWQAATGDPHSTVDPHQLAAVQAALKQNPNYHGFFNGGIEKPNSDLTQFAGSKWGALGNGYLSGATAGFNDEAMAGANALAGNGSYSDNLAKFNALKGIQASEHPGMTLAGNVAGGLVGTLAGGAGLKAAGILKDGAPMAEWLAANPLKGQALGDAAYGGLYGAGENNDNRIGGAVGGALTGAGVGMFARGAGRAIAPVAGKAAELYANGVLPTIGQRAALSGGFFGKALSGAEQALQSVPVAGVLPALSRGAAREQFQVGAINKALGALSDHTLPTANPLPTALPKGMGPGTAANNFTRKAFDDAYDSARSNMQFQADPQFGQDLGKFQQGIANGSLNDAERQQVNSTVAKALAGRVDKSGTMNGDNYKAAVSDLGSIAQTWGKDPNKAAMAPYLRDFSTLVDNAARRNSAPEAAQALDAADKGYAQFALVRNAAGRGGLGKDAGTFSPIDYAAAVKDGGGGIKSSAYTQGRALSQDYAEAGLGLRDTLPNSGTPERLMLGQAVTGGAGGLAGAGAAVAAHPLAALAFAPYALGKLGRAAIAPNDIRLPPWLAQRADTLGNGIYNNSGMFAGGAVPAMLGGPGGQ